MIKKMLFVVFASLALSSCDKEDRCGTLNTVAPAEEVNTLRNYIQSNGIAAVEDSRGFFYTITAAGEESKPNICSGLVVNYVGKLTDGTTFDSGNNVSFTLSNLIAGWQEGLPLIGKNGTIVLYLPPSLGYGGSTSNPKIPANSILIFYVGILDIK